MTWNRKSRMSLIERLEMYVSAGLPIAQSLELCKRGSPKKLSESLGRIRDSVESGRTLSASLGHESRLPSAISGIIDCGESSGSLAQALKSAHALLEREDDLIKKCLSAMTYPTVIGIAAVVLSIALMRGIMPQIIPLLTGMHEDLPILTKISIWISGALVTWGIFAGLSLGLAITIAIASYKRSALIRRLVHSAILRLPIIGSLVCKYALTIFFRSVGALVESGMPAEIAYESSASAVSLIPLRRSLMGRAEALKRGEPMNGILPASAPPYAVSLIAAGEASGSLAQSLSRASTLMDRELEHALKRLTALVEPVMMMAMGGMVGAIALSIMMPIYDISKALQH